jgi:hypothetical protein
MKAMRYQGSREKLVSMRDEYKMIGYDAEIVDNELLVYYGKRPRKLTKKQQQAAKAERWTKRERSFGYTRG